MSEKSQDLSWALGLVLQALKEKWNTDLWEQLVQALWMRDIVSKIIEKPIQEGVERTPESIEAKIDRLYDLCRMPNSWLYFVSQGQAWLNQIYNIPGRSLDDKPGRRIVYLKKGEGGTYWEIEWVEIVQIFNPKNQDLPLESIVMWYGDQSSSLYWKKGTHYSIQWDKFMGAFDQVCWNFWQSKSQIFTVWYNNHQNKIDRAFIGIWYRLFDEWWTSDSRWWYCVFWVMVNSKEWKVFDNEVNLFLNQLAESMYHPSWEGYKILFWVLRKINPELADYIETLPKPQ